MTDVIQDSASPAHGQQVITACALIHHDFDGVTKVFLPKRADAKKFLPGVYELPGGHIDFGENIVDGLKREVREELGIDITVGDPFYVFDYTNAVKGSHSLEVIYFATLVGSLENITLNPEVHSTAGWFSRAELAEVHTTTKGVDDPEIIALNRAFALLEGASLNFGDEA